VKWEIVLDETAVRDFDDLDKLIQKRIARFLYERVAKLEDPRGIGEALKGASLGEFWKYRVGDYRLIAKIRDQFVQILIVKIGNRREVYR
jgi:mRNA interferase RelE/StbE